MAETAETTTTENPVSTAEYAPKQRQDIENPEHDSSHTHSTINKQGYPD